MFNNFPISKYHFYNDANGTIYAVTHYAGKPIRAKASCSPNDEFNEETGRNLAALRCNAKVAEKRVKRLEQKYQESFNKYNEARLEAHKFQELYAGALEAKAAADFDLENFFNK